MPPIHIIHIVHSFGIGGLENGIVNLANRMNPTRFKISIVSLTGGMDSKERITRKDVNCVVIQKNEGVSSHEGIGNDWFLPFKLAKFFKKEKADIIHTHGWGTFLEGILAAKLARIPILIHGEHGTDQLDLARRRIAYRMGAWGVDTILAVCENMRDRFICKYHIPAKKIQTIRNGVDTEYFKHDKNLRQATRQNLGIRDDNVVIGTIGRLCYEKNYETLLRAIALIVNKHSSIQLIMVGDGPYRGSLTQLAVDLGIESRVHFLGTRYDRLELLNAMDVFALTSVSEGLPNTLLEAMSVGLPVVTTSVGGIPEVVTTQKDGLLVEPQNSQGFAKSLEQLLQASELRDQLGAAAHKRMESKFSLKNMVQEYENMYLAKANN